MKKYSSFFVFAVLLLIFGWIFSNFSQRSGHTGIWAGEREYLEPVYIYRDYAIPSYILAILSFSIGTLYLMEDWIKNGRRENSQ